MLPPNNVTIRQLSQEEGFPRRHCTIGGLRHAVRGSFCPTLMPAPRAGLRATSSQPCWKQPLSTKPIWPNIAANVGFSFPAQIAAWRSACEQANDWDRASTARLGQATKDEKKRVKDLERELARKDRALAETAALLVLRKKAQAIWGGDEDA